MQDHSLDVGKRPLPGLTGSGVHVEVGESVPPQGFDLQLTFVVEQHRGRVEEPAHEPPPRPQGGQRPLDNHQQYQRHDCLGEANVNRRNDAAEHRAQADCDDEIQWGHLGHRARASSSQQYDQSEIADRADQQGMQDRFPAGPKVTYIHLAIFARTLPERWDV